MNWHAIFQNAAQYICLICIAALCTVSGVCILAYTLAPVVAWLRRHWLDSLLVAPFVVGLVFYGGGKITTSITYPRTDPEVWYLANNGSYVTNDAVHVAFTRNLVVPQTAWFYLYALDQAYTNQADWAKHSFCAYSNTFANMSVPFDFAYHAASNFNWIAFTDWTPSPTTHTNGVAYASWQRSINGSTNVLSTVKTGIYVDALRISPNPAITNGPPVGFTLQLTPNTQNDE